MRRIHKKMRTAVFCTVLCAFLGGCGGKEELVILSSFFGENPGKRGAMMRRIHKKMRTAVFCTVLCAFLGGCGGKEELVILSSANPVQQMQEAEGEPAASKQSETAKGEPAASKQPDTGNGAGTADAESTKDSIFVHVCGAVAMPGVVELPEGKGEPAASKQPDTGNGAGTADAESTKDSIFVHVCGAVAMPGVVELPEGSRTDDALRAAGGFLDNAARDYVNLAARAEDGQMLYFPTKEEAAELKEAQKILQQAETEEAAGIVNINTADKEQLCTLPGVGESRAADIIAYREKSGGFKRIEEIMNVPGIKEGAYEKLKAKIRTE